MKDITRDEALRISKKLLCACKIAYRKHHLDDPSIGWDEVSVALHNALCEAMGDAGYQEWMGSLKKEG